MKSILSNQRCNWLRRYDYYLYYSYLSIYIKFLLPQSRKCFRRLWVKVRSEPLLIAAAALDNCRGRSRVSVVPRLILQLWMKSILWIIKRLPVSCCISVFIRPGCSTLCFHLQLRIGLHTSSVPVAKQDESW